MRPSVFAIPAGRHAMDASASRSQHGRVDISRTLGTYEGGDDTQLPYRKVQEPTTATPCRELSWFQINYSVDQALSSFRTVALVLRTQAD